MKRLVWFIIVFALVLGGCGLFSGRTKVIPARSTVKREIEETGPARKSDGEIWIIVIPQGGKQ